MALISVWLRRFAEARVHIEEAIRCAHETENALIESGVHLWWTMLLDALGDYKQADVINDAYPTLTTEWSLIQHRVYHWVLRGQIAYHRGDPQAAVQSADRALAVIEDAGGPRMQGWLPWTQTSALIVRAHARVATDNLDAAVDDYRDALSIKIVAGPRTVAVDARAGLARVAMRKGNLARAMDTVEAILNVLADRSLDGAMEPLRIRLTCIRVLDAAGDPRADEILETAHSLLMARAKGIEDETHRLSYLGNVQAHREIRRLWAARDR